MAARVLVELRDPGRVLVDGVPLALVTAQWRIVAALVLRPAGLRSEELLLVSGASTLGSMRTLVTAIRRQLDRQGVDGATTLRFSGGRYRLAGATHDLREEAAAIDRARSFVPNWCAVADELAPHVPALTTTVSVASLDDDDPSRSTQWERQRLEGLALLVEAELRSGSAATAAALVERADVIEPDERFAVLGAVAEYKLGRQRQALRLLASLRSALLEEFGQPPSRTASELEIAILRQDLGLAGWTDADPADLQQQRPLPLPIAVSAERALHGRASEIAALEAASGAHRASLVMITGPSGIGKTALIAAWAASRHGSGATVLWAQAGVSQSEYGVISQLMDQLLGPSASDYRSDLDAADALLSALRSTRDAVIVLDHADAISPGEAHALSLALGGRGARGPLTIVAESAGHPNAAFTDLYVSQAASGAARTLDVGPVDAGAVREIVVGHAGRDTHQVRVLARELFDSSNGNPLHVRLALETGQRQSEALSTLLDRAFDAVGPDAMDVLELAAVLGPRWHLTELARLCGWPIGVVSDALAPLVRRGLVAETADGEYRIVHEATRRRIVARMGPTREAILHARLSRALDDTHDRTGWLIHAVRALAVTGAPTVLDAAVEHSRRLIDAGSYREALQVAMAASEGAARCASTTDSQRVAVLAAHAAALEHHGDRDGARELHDQAWALALATGRDSDLVKAARALGVTGESMTPEPEHVRRLQLALQRCAHPADRSSLALRVAQVALNRGDLVTAAMALDDPTVDTELTTHTKLLLERHLRDESPDVATRLRLACEAARRAEDAGDLESLAVAAAYRSIDLFVSGRLAEAFESWDDEDRIAIQRPTPKERWFAAARRCFVSQLGDDADRSASDAAVALDLGLELGFVDAWPAYGVQLFCIRARHGGLVDLLDLLEQQAGAPGAPTAWQMGFACAVLEAGDVTTASELVAGGVAAMQAAPTRYASCGWMLAGRVVAHLPRPPAAVVEAIHAALVPWSGLFAVVGTSVGYLGPVDSVLAPLAMSLGDPRAGEFEANARRLSDLFNVRSRA